MLFSSVYFVSKRRQSNTCFFSKHFLSCYIADHPRVWKRQLLLPEESKNLRTLMPVAPRTGFSWPHACGRLHTRCHLTQTEFIRQMNLNDSKPIQSKAEHMEGCGQWRYLFCAMNVSIIQNSINALFSSISSKSTLHRTLVQCQGYSKGSIQSYKQEWFSLHMWWLAGVIVSFWTPWQNSKYSNDIFPPFHYLINNFSLNPVLFAFWTVNLVFLESI